MSSVPISVREGSLTFGHLSPCPRCGVANGMSATACWKCDARLRRRIDALSAPDSAEPSIEPDSNDEWVKSLFKDSSGDAAPDSSPPVSWSAKPIDGPRAGAVDPDHMLAAWASTFVDSKPFAPPGKVPDRWRIERLLPAVLIVALAIGGYYAYEGRPPSDAALPQAAASIELSEAPAAGNPSAERLRVALDAEALADANTADSAPPEPQAVAADEPVGVAQTPSAPPTRPVPLQSVTTVKRAKDRSESLPRAEAAQPAYARAAADAVVRTPQPKPYAGPCTEAIAALGLCNP